MKNDLPNDYEINEADIDKILRHLKLAHPEDKITPEMAIDKLEEMYENSHNLAHTNPKLLENY